MYSCDFSDELTNCSVLSGGNEDLLEELESLKQLHDLSITLESATALLRICDSKLQSCLLSCESVTPSYKAALEITLESLEIDYVGEEKKLLASYNLHNSMVRSHKCFNSLKHVRIDSCPILKDLTWLIFAPNLIHLGVVFCPKMEKVLMPLGEGENGSPFAKLELLILIDLPELKSIYWKALRVPHLKEIRVRSIPQLKKLPLNSNSTAGCGTVIYGEKYWANELEWEDEGSRHAFLPCFISW
ncbi:hypothetical protein VitviT2T_013894 [Vitis vinifera]|uniref:Disease resistance protein At4g27190-like leucine-rich repeats domain-containing protein n=1 Tax=Vitis vinifera TaxID=29760 RepID=A0ABY9CJ24_VITVI|nr:hypothetical protein VitviT2T_013894 [Vitis vinifera]